MRTNKGSATSHKSYKGVKNALMGLNVYTSVTAVLFTNKAGMTAVTTKK